MESFLLFNGHEILATAEEQVEIILRVASSEVERDDFTAWLREHIKST